jgi:hypothetical protein
MAPACMSEVSVAPARSVCWFVTQSAHSDHRNDFADIATEVVDGVIGLHPNETAN